LAALAAQDEPSILDMSLEQLQNVVVTDTKVAQAQDTVTQKVEIVDAAEIRRHTALNRNISELLLYRSGLFVNTLSRNDANWGSFGGLGPKYNGYLLDGLPIDSFVDSMSLSPWAFERVELYKGPASVMYSNYLTMDFAGNETPLAGITNFVLKDTIDSQLTRLQIGGGSFGTMNGKLYHQGASGKLSYFVGGNFEQADYTNYGTSDSWLYIINDPDYTKGALYGKASYRLGEDDSLSLFAHHTSHSGTAGRPNRDFDHSYDTVNLAYAHQLTDALNLQLKGGYRNYDRLSGEDYYPASFDSRSHEGVDQQVFPVDLSFTFQHLGQSLLTFGADTQITDYQTYSEANGGSTTLNQVSSQSRGVFVQEKLVLDRWVLRAGGRYNITEHSYETINGAEPSGSGDNNWRQPLWSIGARYNASPELALYANTGTSFVVPSAKQLWGTTSDLTQAGQLPNTGLREENGQGSDIGFEWRPLDTWSIGVRGFLNQLDDAIIDNVVSQAPSQSQSINAGEARSYGAELMVDHKVNDNWHWFANLTHTVSEVTNPADHDHDGSEIPFVPDLMANAGCTASLPWAITLSPYLHMVGSYYDSTAQSSRRQFGSFWTANLRLEKSLLKTSGYTVDSFVELDNLTNERFEMPWGFQDPGFSAFVGLEAAVF